MCACVKSNPMPDKILIIIPCYNEASALINLLDELKTIGHDVLVIDDGSTDSTFRIASERCMCIRHEKNKGLGQTILTGVGYARDNGYTLCMRIDGDGQHHPSEITKLIDSYRESPANIIIGSRYLSQNNYRTTLPRRAAAWSIAALLAALYGKKYLHDPISGMRLMDAKAIAFFSTHYSAAFPEAVEIAQGYKHGFSIREMSVKVGMRESGKSSLYGLYALVIFVQMMAAIVALRFSKPD